MYRPEQTAGPQNNYPDLHLSNPSPTGDTLPEDRAGLLLARLQAYDPSTPEAAHLRTHQSEAVQAFQQVVGDIVSGRIDNKGMAILHPTGSGKTVTAAEIVRMTTAEVPSMPQPVRTLMLVPGHQILDQTTGYDDEIGTLHRFVPEVTVGEYSGRTKQTDAQVTVMTYQSLPGAIERGAIDTIDPGLIICDENHHIIDGKWAQAVTAISSDRLLLGMTATPAYSSDRNIRTTFPYELDRKTMREGIESGILAGVQGYVYKGTSQIKITRGGVDFAEEDLFEAISSSEDNYLAVKICAESVEQGGKGVVSCVPGHDRAHAKVMAEMLKATNVRTDEGVRPIRAAYVGGEMPKDVVRKLLLAHRRGEIDVLTSVNLIFEGWDSPETDFMVIMRPTASIVLAEQRIGRVLRPRPGKTATVHELIYGIEGGDLEQVTHLDVLGEGRVMQGRHFKAATRPSKPADPGERKHFGTHNFVLSPELAERVAELDAIPLEEMRILCRQDSIPFEWETSLLLARKFGRNLDEIEQILEQAKVHSRTEQVGDVTHSYFPPRANKVIADNLGIIEPPEGAATLTELLSLGREFTPERHLSRKAAQEVLESEGFASETFCLEDGTIIHAYRSDARLAIQALAEEIAARSRQPRKPKNSETKPAIQPVTPPEAIEWLNQILVNPESAADLSDRQQIVSGQRHLLEAITMISNGLGIMPLSDTAVSRLGVKPTDQMNNVMRTKGLTFNALLTAGAISKGLYEMKKQKRKK